MAEKQKARHCEEPSNLYAIQRQLIIDIGEAQSCRVCVSKGGFIMALVIASKNIAPPRLIVVMGVNLYCFFNVKWSLYGVSKEHLQCYVNEFILRHNMRKFITSNRFY